MDNTVRLWTASSGGQVAVIYIDFAKAFDTVPHRRLLNKIKSYNINQRLILWIQDFLCSRKQSIGVNGEFSSWFDVVSGIPQGSILGPLLFLVYINDLPELCASQDDSSKLYLYADDAKISKVVSKKTDQLDLQAIMNTVKTWSDEWLLQLNIDQCKTVSYYLKYPPLDTQYHIVDGNTTYILQKLNSINDLGVIFDSNLTFKDHMAQKISHIVSWVSLKEILYTWTSRFYRATLC